MKTPITTAIAVFGGASAAVLTVGFGAAGVSPAGSTTAVTPHPSSSVATTQPGTAIPGAHLATLVGCIPGANC